MLLFFPWMDCYLLSLQLFFGLYTFNKKYIFKKEMTTKRYLYDGDYITIEKKTICKLSLKSMWIHVTWKGSTTFFKHHFKIKDVRIVHCTLLQPTLKIHVNVYNRDLNCDMIFLVYELFAHFYFENTFYYLKFLEFLNYCRKAIV